MPNLKYKKYFTSNNLSLRIKITHVDIILHVCQYLTRGSYTKGIIYFLSELWT